MNNVLIQQPTIQNNAASRINRATLLLLIDARHNTVATATLEFTLKLPFRTKIYNLIPLSTPRPISPRPKCRLMNKLAQAGSRSH